MQSSPWNDERITSYVFGELPPDQAIQLEAEMFANPEFAQAVEEARTIATQLSVMYAAEPTMTLDAAKRTRLWDAHAASAPSAPSGPTILAVDRWAVSKPWLTLAASMLLMGTLGAWLFAQRDSLQIASSDTRRALEPAGFETPRNAPSPSGSLLLPTDLSSPASPPASANPSSLAAEVKKRQAVPSLPTTSRDEGIGLADQQDWAGQAASAAPADLALEPLQGMRSESKDASTHPFSQGEVNSSADKLAPEFSQQRESGKTQDGESLVKSAEKTLRDVSSLPSPAVKDAGAKTTPRDKAWTDGLKRDGSHSTDLSRGLVLEREAVRFAENSEPAGAPTDFFNSVANDRGSNLDVGGGMGMGMGMGPGMGGDRYEPIQENEFRRVNEEPLSTFSIDVDTASYSKVRQFLLNAGSLPPAGAVRVEELMNYFDYAYPPPAADSEHPLASLVELASCPWNPEHHLARIAIKGKVIANESRPASNLVFLVDTSGSMNQPNKLPLVKQGLQKLVGRLGERDRVAIVVYAGSAGLVLDSTPAAERSKILRQINQMQSGGSTNGGDGIRLAYQVARDHFLKDGVNRLILCSDGDFNVGTTSDDELVRLVESESKGGIDLTVLGFGIGNHNDAMMEKISGRGNGNYAFIDSQAEAHRVLVEQTSSTLVTIARDVKIQVEFNPAEVAAYRLIGYENRRLANEDFKDDTKDAGEIGAGHSVTALYELIPARGDTAVLPPAVDALRYQSAVTATPASQSGEWLTVKLRYKQPDSDTSTAVSFPAISESQAFAAASPDFRFATAVAGFGMLLRSSQHVGHWTFKDVQQVAQAAKGEDFHGLRSEFVELVEHAAQLRVGEK